MGCHCNTGISEPYLLFCLTFTTLRAFQRPLNDSSLHWPFGVGTNISLSRYHWRTPFVAVWSTLSVHAYHWVCVYHNIDCWAMHYQWYWGPISVAGFITDNPYCLWPPPNLSFRPIISSASKEQTWGNYTMTSLWSTLLWSPPLTLLLCSC